jgi:osmotically-inducible protein OsmY
MTRFHIFFSVVFLATTLVGCNKQAIATKYQAQQRLMRLQIQAPLSTYQQEDLAQKIRSIINTLGMGVANNISINAASNNVTLSGMETPVEQKQMVLSAVREIGGINVIADKITVAPIN